MELSFSVTSDPGDEYRVRLSSFDADTLPVEAVALLDGEIEIVDVVLERAKGNNPTPMSVILKIPTL